ncbi:MAG: ferrous iron transport protein B [Spirochaetes bacterium]|nr:ferrous iron transport protein B [Spirochaetota bacterium]
MTPVKKNSIVVGLVGNPNSGKTTIFNALTGARQKVANWSGVTVEKREGTVRHNGHTIKFVDLPGTYSLSSYSIEEIITRDFILNDRPDVIMNVVDAGNIERNLYLTSQLIDMGAKVIMALNMVDEADSKGFVIDTDKLGILLGIHIIKTVGTKSSGIDDLKNAVVDIFLKKSLLIRHIHLNYGADVETEIKKVQSAIWTDESIGGAYSTRWLSIGLLENDSDIKKRIREYPHFSSIMEQSKKGRTAIEKKFKDSIETVLSDMRYGFITGALKESLQRTAPKRIDLSEKIDKIILNRYLAFPILIIFMWALFQLTFTLGEYPMHVIERVVEFLSLLIHKYVASGFLKDLISDGIIGGVGGVIVFLPNILILFMGISFMEDTGYMARAAFKMDRIMHKIGLHGKSFISLAMGFGCNVPAIMAARSLENPQDRILTILINPFMSCSARLPVYVLFAGIFFKEHAGNVITSLYLTGIIIAFISAKLFKYIFFREESAPFVMELPPYRMPAFKTILLHMWDRGSQYLKKMAGIILIFSIIVWLMGQYPKSSEIEKRYFDKINTITEEYHVQLVRARSSYGLNSKEITALEDRFRDEIDDIFLHKKIDETRYTVIGRLGDLIYPVMKPLGFNWQMGISLITGFVAKEIVVSTMGVLYQSSETEPEPGDVKEPLYQVMKKKEHGVTPLIAYTFLLFVLLYVPCLASIVAIGREAGWKWAFFSIFYQMTVAWTVCFIFYRVGLMLGF